MLQTLVLRKGEGPAITEPVVMGTPGVGESTTPMAACELTPPIAGVIAPVRAAL